MFLGASSPQEDPMQHEMILRRTTAQQQRRAMVVEDQTDVALGLALLLEQQGYAVKVARHAQEGLDQGKIFSPDVVFLDIGLPDRSGYEACMQMRGTEWGAKAYIVAVTGRNEPGDLLRAANTGFDRHVGKPMQFDTLKEILHTVEDRAR